MKNLSASSRREFFKASAGFTLAAGLAGTGSLWGAGDAAKRWKVAIRDAHLRVTGKPDCWTALQELGAAGIEAGLDENLRCTGLHHPDRQYSVATPDGVKLLKDDLAAHGMVITALYMANRFDERLDEEMAWAKKVVGAAQALGVNAVRIDVVPRKIEVDRFLPFAIKACRQLAELVRGTPVRFAIENHGRLTNDPAFLSDLFEGVGSAQVGLTLDTMNFYWYGHPLDEVYGICEKFGPRAFHTHCKNLRYPAEKRNMRRPMGWEYSQYAAPVYDGDIDYRRVAEILRKANYQGDLCLENECLSHFSKEQQTGILHRELALLQGLT